MYGHHVVVMFRRRNQCLLKVLQKENRSSREASKKMTSILVRLHREFPDNAGGRVKRYLP